MESNFSSTWKYSVKLKLPLFTKYVSFLELNSKINTELIFVKCTIQEDSIIYMVNLYRSCIQTVSLHDIANNYNIYILLSACKKINMCNKPLIKLVVIIFLDCLLLFYFVWVLQTYLLFWTYPF